MVESATIVNLLRVIIPAMYGLAAFSYVAEFTKNSNRHHPWTLPLFGSAMGLHALLFIQLLFIFGHPPYDSAFRGLFFVSLVVSLFYSGIERFLGEIRYGAFILPVNFAATAVASAFLNRGVPLPETLNSSYFLVHTTLLFLAYACFMLSFVISIMYLLQYREIRSHRLGWLFKRLPSLADMDLSVTRLDALGLGLLAVGIATGFLWLEMVMGAPQRLSLKIGCAGCAMIVYLAEHLLRITRGWNGQRGAWLSIAGFICIILTMLAGRHGY